MAADPTAELIITKAVNPNQSPYSPGDTFSYSISLTCNSNLSEVCNDAQLNDALPAPLVFDPAVQNPVSVGGASANSITVGTRDFTIDFTQSTPDGPGLVSGENMTITVFVAVPDDTTAEFNGQDIINTANATATNADPQSATATITVNVVEKLDSTVLKSVDDNQPDGQQVPGVPQQPVDYTIGGGNASNRTVDTIVVQDPADGVAGPLEGYLDFRAIGSITPPAGADQVKIEYRDAAGNWQPATDTGPIPADPSGIPGITPLSDVKGLRFTFSSSAGELPITPPSGEARIVVQTSTNSTVENIPQGQTATVVNTASSLVTVGAASSAPQTANASVVISNALPNVGVEKSFFDSKLLAGESTTAKITSTNSNLAVVSMLITEPSPGQPNLLDQGLDFSGFTGGVEWPAGATEVSVTYHYADGSTETRATQVADNIPPPTRAGVTGFDVLFTGTIEPNSSAEIPFTVTARPIDGSRDVISTNETTATVVDATGRTASDTGADTITLQPARVSTTIDKRIARDDMFAVPGSTMNVTMLGAVNDAGVNASTIGSNSLIITDPDPAGGTTPFWNTFDLAQITAGVPGNATLKAEYLGADGVTWVTFDGASAIAGATTWIYAVPAGLRDIIRGVRFTYLPKTGVLPPGFTVAPTLSTTMRSTFRDGSGSVTDAAAAAPAPGLTVDNRAQAAVSNPDDTDPTDNTATAVDEVVLKPFDGIAPDLLEKRWLNDQVFAFSDEQRTTRLNWATEGLPFSSVVITDPASTSEITDVATSVYDAFDLARIEPITPALDPSMQYDRVAKVELADGSTTDGAVNWTDITGKVCGLAVVCDGTFPGYTLSDAERASTLGVRISYAEGSNRSGAGAPALGSGVAASFGKDRGLDLTFQIRQVKRSDDGPVVGILHDDTYNTGAAGVVNNTVNLTGIGPVPVSQGDGAAITILDTTVNVSVTKAFDQTELPVPPAGTPADEFPLVTSTITATNETESKIGQLTISDPSPAQPAPTAFQYLNLYSIDNITVPTGATQSVVTLLRGAATQTYTVAEAQGLPPADLADVTGFSVVHSDPTRTAVAAGAASTVTLTFQSREIERVPINATPRVDITDRVDNIALATVERPGGNPNLDSAAGSADATLAFVAAIYGITASKTITPASRYEDDARTGYRLTLAGQPTGNVRTTTMTLTDATPTFWNAFDFASFPQVTLPLPVRQLRVSVLVGAEYQTSGGAITSTCNGSADLTACWTVGQWQTAATGGAITPVLPAGVTADQVRGVRFDVRRNAANANWERPRNPTVTVTVTATRRTVLHVGPAGQVDSYPVPSTLPGLQTAPGETVQGTTTDDLQVHGVGAWGRPDVGTTWTADASDSDTTILQHRVNAITVEKSPGNGQGGAGSQQFPPNSPIPYAMTITNSGAWAMTGLTLTDTVGTNGQGSLLVEPAGATDTFGFALVNGAGTALATTGFAASLDPSTGIISITVPAGFVFNPSDKLTITAALVFQTGLAPTTPVGNSITASSDRDFERCSFTSNNRPVTPNTTNVDLCTATTTVTPSAAAPIQVVKAVKGVAAGVPGAAPGDANYDDLGVLSTGRLPAAAACDTPNAGRGYYTNTCVPITRPGGTESWRTTFTNLGNIPSEQLAAIDVLPAPGDTGVTVGTQRGSNWAPTLLGQVATTAAPGTVLTAYYLNTVPNRVCNAKDIESSARAGGIPTTDPCYADVNNRAWTVFTDTTPTAQLASAKAIKFVLTFPAGAGLAPRASVDISFQTRTAWSSPSTGTGTLPIAWNAVAAGSRGSSNGAEIYLGPVEPVRTGVAMPTARLSLAKTVVTPTGWTAPLPSSYTFTLSCTSGGQPVAIVNGTGASAATVTLLPDGTVLTVGASLNIPLYADCTVTETPTQGAKVSYVPTGTNATSSGAITALSDFSGRTDIAHPFASTPVQLQRIQATNTYEFAGFTVSKSVVNGGAVDQDGAAIVYDPFPVHAVCTFRDTTVLDQSFTLQDPPVAPATSSRTFDALPAGADCTVTETDNHGASTSIVVTRDGSSTAPSNRASTAFTLLADAPARTHLNAVAITNTFTVGSLAITKSATGTWAGQFGDFTVQATCTLAAANPNTVFSDTAVLTKDGPGNVWRIDDLPTGASCAITETDDGGATQSTITPASVTIGSTPAQPSTVAVANDFRVGGFSVSKTVDGSGVPTFSDGPFEFGYNCTYEGQDVGFGEVEISGDGTAGPFVSSSVTGLPVGTDCVVSETADGGADAAAADVTVTIPDVAGGEPQVATASFLNRFTAGTIAVTKALDGAAAGEDWATDATYTIHVTCQVNTGGDRVTLFDGDVELTGAGTVMVQDAVNGGDLLLPVGTHCWGDETDLAGATSTAIDFDSYDNAAIVTAQAGNTTQPLEITATNTFAYGSLVLRKQLGGDTVLGTGRTFEIEVTCTFDRGGNNPTLTLVDHQLTRLQGGETERFDDLPIGSSCWAEETDSQGAWEVQVSATEAAPVVISAADGDVTLTVTNIYRNAGFTVSKAIDNGGAVDQHGDPIAYDLTYSFTASCLFLGDESITLADRSFTLRDGQSKEFSGLPAGAGCSVSETGTGGAASTTIVISESGVDGAPIDGPDASFTLSPDTAGTHATTVGVTNSYTVGSVDITKEVTGAGADAWGTGDFPVRLLCTLPDAVSNPVFDETAVVTRANPLWIVGDLPTDASCVVTEIDDAGATESSVNPAGAFTIGDAESGPSLVTVTNDFRVGGLNVVKQLTGPGVPDFSNGPFVYSVICTYEGAQVYDGTLTLTGDGTGDPITSTTITGIPVGAECIVTETDDGGADATPDPVTVTIPDDGDNGANVVTAGFVNEFSLGTIAITKVLDGAAQDEDYATSALFVIQVTCQLEGQDGTLLTLFSGPVTVSGGETVVVTDDDGDPLHLPYRTHCFAAETDAGGATSSSIDFDSFDNAAIVTVVDAPQEIGIVATNVFDYGSIDLSKVITGATAQANGKRFQIELTCTLQRGANPASVVLDGEMVILAGGETRRFDDLPIGAECWAQETDKGGAAAVKISATQAEPAVVTADSVVNITVENRFDPPLAVTGVDGDALRIQLTAGIVLLLGGAVIGLTAFLRRRRRKS
ncbi:MULTISPECIES: DUF5979 domain-containing protein [unclassified Leifsonia]|uniref:DUF5979 domain-containing protein n=1 Tax=unclassified Leifsonia TaxID=2663824 RepID=UPI0006F66064|nr:MULTISPECIES: DUF5979 domain-containing protein [unclassified Leifsonia]KQX07766.1 hypothetical protein ASC59_08545 [Leifsonia sp. Root1293]KRA12048.1 hypothetical protein ASD61_08545 [Leifsonia sp. Root60]